VGPNGDTLTAVFTAQPDEAAASCNASGTSFEHLFLTHYKAVVAAVYRVIGDRAQAEELAADVFLKLYRQPLATERDHNFAGWLYRSAIRVALDALRSSGRRKRNELAAHADSGASDPFEETLREQQRARVRHVLAELKPRQAELLLLRTSGLSYKQLADTLNINVASIGTLLARAEAEFEKRYRALYGGHR
jgi:RNA polymerase sigma-70 factor (ECF subfamily)